uniref:Uncharacterized protein n=1 Tax=Magallana gigas TaxID=29159 RepID=K1PHJ5_MAGGI
MSSDIVALEYIIENIRNHSAIEFQRREKLRDLFNFTFYKCIIYLDKRPVVRYICTITCRADDKVYDVVADLDNREIMIQLLCLFSHWGKLLMSPKIKCLLVGSYLTVWAMWRGFNISFRAAPFKLAPRSRVYSYTRVQYIVSFKHRLSPYISGK